MTKKKSKSNKLEKKYPELVKLEKEMDKKHNQMVKINEQLKAKERALKKAQSSYDQSYKNWVESYSQREAQEKKNAQKKNGSVKSTH